MKQPKYVAFATQKGGAGKTTLTVLVATYLHYVKGYYYKRILLYRSIASFKSSSWSMLNTVKSSALGIFV